MPNIKLRGRQLDEAIQLEVELIRAEGTVNEITAVLIHRRLKSKGIIDGQVSTLSTKRRKDIIAQANAEYLRGLGMSNSEEKIFLSRNSKAAYLARIKRQNKEIQRLKDQLSTNTHTLISIIRMLKVTTPIPIESILSDFLIAELRKAEDNPD
ncbi:hypothetical protein [Vibrio bivalvicida]|uniref:Uncharacterized protein n=1 Tax=Vibrio bivalvicida TaxID=1276888 RepID=A0A177Y1H6_9VIBR|nr:hypothetical protein [Vibrio bivalvicida]OAJ94456.1 hypothetical protein APB76_09760 [Vibrio bivalvicida]